MTRPLAVTTTRTVISFFVSVPVLSEAITVAEPSVSTAARCRTIAFRRAMRCTPIESTAVTTAGRPSGTAATASATPRMSTSNSAAAAAHVFDDDDRDDHDDGDRDDDEAEQLAGTIELPLQRRRLVGRLLQQPGNATHLGAHAGRGHDRLAVPVGRRRAAEDHVVPIAERHFVGNRRRVLRDRQALARQCGFGGLQRGRFDQPRIGRNRVAFLDEDDVAGNDLGGGNAPPLAVANDRGIGRRHRAQRRHGRLRSRLLDVAHGRVEQDDREDRDRFVGQAASRSNAHRPAEIAVATSSRMTSTPGTARGTGATPGPPFRSRARWVRYARAALARPRRSGRAARRFRAPR